MSLQPRNTELLDALERDAAGHLAAMTRGSLQAGQAPPRHILEWFANYTVEALIATEDMAMQITSDTPEDEAEAVSMQLETCVIILSELLRQLNGMKQLVLVDRIMSGLRSRALRLPTSFDTSYDGMLPRV